MIQPPYYLPTFRESMKDVHPAYAALNYAMGEYPTLTSRGWHTEPQDLEWLRTEYRYPAQIETGLSFIDACKRIAKTPKPTHNSYGLKHAVERWARRHNNGEPYVSNGAFITAALWRGLPVELWPGSPYCGIGISNRALEKLEKNHA